MTDIVAVGNKYDDDDADDNNNDVNLSVMV